MASKHMAGIAFDIAMANHDQDTIEAAARAVGFGGFGFYPRSGFVFRARVGLSRIAEAPIWAS